MRPGRPCDQDLTRFDSGPAMASDSLFIDIAEFTWLGLLTVPAALGLSVVALWTSLTLIGG